MTLKSPDKGPQKDQQQPRQTLSRRTVLKGMAAAAGVAAAGKLGLSPALAQETRGNFPAGVSGSTCFFGFSVPTTGPYEKQGKDILKAYELAVTAINDGSELAKAMSPNITKGILGKTIEYDHADTASNPTKSVEALTRFIKNNKAIMCAGSVSSSVAIANQKLAQREKVIYLPAITGSNATTGQACQRYAFRACHYAYTSSKALAPVLAKELGSDAKVAYLVPDYTYGHSVLDSMKEFTEAQGWETVNEQFPPLGIDDFSPYLTNIATSGANVLVNICFGADAVISAKQAKEFGILDTMSQVFPYMAPFLPEELGPEIMAGVYGATDFWWTLADENDKAAMFVDAFKSKYGYNPEWGAHTGFLQTMLYADAVERAGTFDPKAVIETYESGYTIDTTLGEVSWRKEDHQLIRPVHVVVGKTKDEMGNPEDLLKIVGRAEGKDVMPPIEKFGCQMPEI
mgnify:CR=1 FL=1